MNIAVPALLLVALILPGIIFRRKFREGTWEFPPRKQSIAQQIVEGLLAAAVLHLLWITFATWLGQGPDLELVVELMLAGTASDGSVSELSRRVADTLVPATVYFATIYAGSYMLGAGLHRAVRHLRLDVVFRLFRFENPWYYILIGDPYGIPDQSRSLFSILSAPKESFRRWKRIYDESKQDTEVFVYLQAVQEIAGTSYLYRGLVEEWYFDRSGTLDRLVLVDAARRRLTDDDAPDDGAEISYLEDERYYVFDTDYCVLHLAKLENLSIDWIELESD